MISAGLKYYKIENATTTNVCFWCDTYVNHAYSKVYVLRKQLT